MKNFNLDEHKKIEPPFEVPEGYFNKLNKEILSKTIHAPIEKQSKQVWFTPFNMAAAAAITLLIVASVFTITDSQMEPSVEELLSEVSHEDILHYLDESDLSEEEIITELDLEDFEWIDEGSLDNLELDVLDLNELMDDLNLSDEI